MNLTKMKSFFSREIFRVRGKTKSEDNSQAEPRGDFWSKLIEEVVERFVGCKKKDEGEEEGVFRGELIIKKT